jgi:hypothetical protein
LTERRPHFARLVALLVGIAALHGSGAAWGQGAVRDSSGSLTATPKDQQKKTWLEQRFGGSYAELSAYVGSGSFYTSGYRDPYVSNALYLRPTFQLGTKFDLTLNGRVYLEEEWTTPDTSNGRRFYPLDSWLFLKAANLYTAPRAKIKVSGTLRLVMPTSYESRYAHLVAGLGAGGGAARAFEFGRPNAAGKRWNLGLSLGGTFTKSLRSSDLRGNFPGDTNGCRAGGGANPGGISAGGAPAAADTDRCGGPLNTSYTIMSSGNASLSHGRYSMSMTLIVINEFRYTVDPSIWGNALSTVDTVPTGRADWTWGIVAFAYDLTDHYALSAGLASYQPALDSRAQNIRFPFFDFNGGNANNFTQFLISLTGTL